MNEPAYSLDWGVIIPVAGTALVGIIGAVTTGWVFLRKGRAEAGAIDTESEVKAEEKRAKIKERADRQAKDEYRELYLEFHEKLRIVQTEHLECHKELARLGVQYAELKKDSEEKDRRIKTLEKKLGLGSDTFGEPGHAK